MCAVTQSASSPLPASPHASALARAFAQSHLCPEHGREAESAVMLLTSELVTHVVLHGEPPITVTVECEVSQVRIAVKDGRLNRFGPRSLPDDLSMILIEKISREWGKETRDGVETIWCTVPTGVIPPRERVRTDNGLAGRDSAGW
jgi:anti-sigma regulatory factor (Ser/Thr protein kinase)